MSGKVGCALLLAVLFAAAAVSRTSFAVFLAALAVLLVQRSLDAVFCRRHVFLHASRLCF